MVQPINQLEYARPISTDRYASEVWARNLMRLSLLFTPVGFLILGIYALTAYEAVGIIGLFWAMCAAFCVLVPGLSSIISLFTERKSVNYLKVRRYYIVALISSILTYPAILICFAVGGELEQSPHFRLVVHNDTKTPLEKVTVHFDDGDVSVGPIPPGGSATSGLKWVGHRSRPLEITTKVGQRDRRKMDRINCDIFDLKGPYYDIHVEKAELPR